MKAYLLKRLVQKFTVAFFFFFGRSQTGINPVDKHTLVYLYSGELGGKSSDRKELLTLLHGRVAESKSAAAQSSGPKGDLGAQDMCVLALLSTLTVVVVALDVRAQR